jgi:hypothetical protein
LKSYVEDSDDLIKLYRYFLDHVLTRFKFLIRLAQKNDVKLRYLLDFHPYEHVLATSRALLNKLYADQPFEDSFIKRNIMSEHYLLMSTPEHQTERRNGESSKEYSNRSFRENMQFRQKLIANLEDTNDMRDAFILNASKHPFDTVNNLFKDAFQLLDPSLHLSLVLSKDVILMCDSFYQAIASAKQNYPHNTALLNNMRLLIRDQLEVVNRVVKALDRYTDHSSDQLKWALKSVDTLIHIVKYTLSIIANAQLTDYTLYHNCVRRSLQDFSFIMRQYASYDKSLFAQYALPLHRPSRSNKQPLKNAI